MKQKTLEWAGPSGFYCSVCDGEPPETHSNLPIGFITIPSEPAMNAAGRTSDHPFKDVRSARRTHQRSKRNPERIYIGNKRRRSDKARPARVAALKNTYERIDSREWEKDREAEWAHKVDMERMDDIAAYYLFGKPLFALPHSVRTDSRPGRTSPTILTAPYAKPHETTLPTSHSEIRAHLTPSKNHKQRCQGRKMLAVPVYGFEWWGEYTRQWHRNLSGCWNLGYGHVCQENCEETCTGPCWGQMLDKCYCEEFGVGTDWEVPAPENVKRCSLVEWMSGEPREEMEDDEAALRRQGRLDKNGRGLEADPGQEREYGHYLDGEYVILEKGHEDSDAWSVISNVDERTCS